MKQKWPKPIVLTKKLKDLLETNVPESYNLKTKVLERLFEDGIVQRMIDGELTETIYMNKGEISKFNSENVLVGQNGIFPTIRTHGTDAKIITFKENKVKLRKLTAKESFRLMGINDERIEFLQSSGLIENRKQYLIAGNSIVVPVLEAIFKGIDFPKDRPLKVFETFAGMGTQSMALENLDYKVHAHTSEWFIDAIIAYALLHHNEEFWKLNNYYSGLNITKEQFLKWLNQWTLSTDSKAPNDLKRLSVEKLRAIYCAQITNVNKGSILDINGKDLDWYDLMTYSFPCQDLSLAGKQKGMSKDDHTRSGLLWEVERILLEAQKVGKLPKVLLMENVPQIHNKQNNGDFQKWQEALMNMGYKNTWRDLNAKNFGVPQNRNRTFMVSILDGEVQDEKGVQLSMDLF